MIKSRRSLPAWLALCAALAFQAGCESGTNHFPADASAPTGAEAEQASPGEGEDPEDGNAVVARIGGDEITLADLDSFIKDQLFDRETRQDELRTYELRSLHLDRLIGVRATEAAAEQAQMPVEDLLDQELAKLEPISDEAVEKYYAENQQGMGGASIDEIRDPIRQYLSRQRVGRIVQQITEASGAETLLTPVRMEVAATGPSKGPEAARVTIVEFSDFQCPYCRRVLPTVEQLIESYPDDVRVVFRHLPLDSLHPQARGAAEASVCAHDQDQFWEYHDVLFENPGQLERADLERYAQELGLDADRFGECLASERASQIVAGDSEAASALGLTGTPVFFINGIPIRGSGPFSEFAAIIDSELRREQPRAASPAG